MFHPMAMTVIFALLSAFVLSLTFIPAMIFLLVKGKLNEKENTIVLKLKAPYQTLLAATLKRPGWTTSFAILLIALSFSLFYRLGEEFVPRLDEKDIAMHAMRIPGTSLTQSTAMQMEVEKTLLQEFPEVDYVFSKTGTAEMASDPMPPNVSDTFIMLKPQKEWPNSSLTKDQLIEKILASLSKLPGNNYEFTQPIEMRFNELISGVRSDLAIKVYGDDFKSMQQASQNIASLLNQIPGAADVKVEQIDGLPVLDIQIDRETASRLGLNVSEILEVISIATGGGNAGQVFEGDRRFDLLVKLPEDVRQDLQALQNLPIPHPSDHSENAQAQLHQVASLKFTEGLNEISRENGKRFISVQANVRGSDLGTFVEKAKSEIQAKAALPDGSWLSWGGQFENLISARNRLMLVVPICFLLIFILLYTAFNSIKDAILVFTGVPLALTGGILFLWVRDMPFSISAAVGFIALSGIAVLNGLVLVTHIDQLRKEGKELKEAITDGALTRFRPVLMTALVASFGFIPMALSTGTGAEVQKPLATVVIGGLISSTFLTLLVLPALYQLLSGNLRWKFAFRQWILNTAQSQKT